MQHTNVYTQLQIGECGVFQKVLFCPHKPTNCFKFFMEITSFQLHYALISTLKEASILRVLV